MKRATLRNLPELNQPVRHRLPLKHWIKARGFTIKRLADVLDVRPETLSRIASGAQPLSLGMQRRIAYQLGLTPEEEILAFGLPGRGTIGSGDRDLELRDGAGAAGKPRLMRIDRLRQSERPAGGAQP